MSTSRDDGGREHRSGEGRSTGTPTQAPADPADERDPQKVLYLSPQRHRVYHSPKMRDKKPIRFRTHRPLMNYTLYIEDRMKTLGLYHLVRLREIYPDEIETQQVKIDTGLLTALVEFWRPESHSFHFSFGEMTVTLQDVACLWGLWTKGEPVTGWTDKDWLDQIRYLIGQENISDYVKDGRRSIVLSKLRQRFENEPNENDHEELDRYALAFGMELIGCIMFPDNSGDSVPAHYLDILIGDLQRTVRRNWGGAVLAFLYRNLDSACQGLRATCAGPWLLLMLWSWTRLPPGRPTHRADYAIFNDWGQPDRDSCAPFGRKWTLDKSRYENPSHVSFNVIRDALFMLHHNDVVWTPYEGIRNLLPALVEECTDSFLSRLPLILYAVVEWHYPDRVMRQYKYNFYQIIPPPMPENFKDEHRRLSKINNKSHKEQDWRRFHQRYVDMWDDIHIVEVLDYWRQDEYNKKYMAGWFLIYCAGYYPSSVVTGPTVRDLDNPPPRTAAEDVEGL